MFPHFFIHEKESLGEQETAARGSYALARLVDRVVTIEQEPIPMLIPVRIPSYSSRLFLCN